MLAGCSCLEIRTCSLQPCSVFLPWIFRAVPDVAHSGGLDRVTNERGKPVNHIVQLEHKFGVSATRIIAGSVQLRAECTSAIPCTGAGSGCTNSF